MNFELSDEQTLLADSARRYVREHFGVEARRRVIAGNVGFEPKRWSEFADLGWLALNVSEDAGGLGWGDVELALLMEQLGRGLYNVPFLETAVLAASLVAGSPNSALRESLLETIVSGDGVVVLAHLEPGSRSEYETTVATSAHKEGDGWKISGVKPLVVHGSAASHWIVSARESGASQFSLFLVEATASGTTRQDYSLLNGDRALDLRLDQVSATLLVPADQAEQLLLRALDRTIVAYSAAALGAMDSVMGLTADYLKQRHQYGKPLAQFQALQHRIAEMFVETEQARAMLFQAMSALESGDELRAQRGASGAKALIGKTGQFVTAQGIQLHGGIGITEEYAVGHYYKSMQAFQQRYGDTEFHLRRSLGLANGPR